MPLPATLRELVDVDHNARPTDVQASLDLYGLQGRCVEEHGPAGGNPLWEVSGPFGPLQRWFTEFYPEFDPTAVVLQ